MFKIKNGFLVTSNQIIRLSAVTAMDWANQVRITLYTPKKNFEVYVGEESDEAWQAIETALVESNSSSHTINLLENISGSAIDIAHEIVHWKAY